MVVQPSLKEKIYNAILEDILSHQYEPSDILNEKSLVEKYGCSKSPVREALLALCSDNVLRSIPRYGYEIVRLTMDDVFDMLNFRLVLESGLLSEHYESFTPIQINYLESIDRNCTKAEKDVWTHWKYNMEFHVTLISFCNNAYAVEELKKCMNRLRRAYAQLYWNTLSSSTLSLAFDTRHHADILQALRDKNLEELLRHLKNDIGDFGGLTYNLSHTL